MNNLNEFNLKKNNKNHNINIQLVPSLNCYRIDNKLKIYLFYDQIDNFIRMFYIGLFKKLSYLIWKLNIDVKLVDIGNDDDDDKKFIDESNRSKTICYEIEIVKSQQIHDLSNGFHRLNNAFDFYINDTLFKTIYPYTFVFDRQLNIKECGNGFTRHFIQANQDNINLLNYFYIIEPKFNHYSFQMFLNNRNIKYKIQLKENQNKCQSMPTISGSLIYIQDYDFLLFIGSPAIKSLDELNQGGIYLSDIPLYDATRDIILVNEQTTAQVDKLRDFDIPRN